MKIGKRNMMIVGMLCAALCSPAVGMAAENGRGENYVEYTSVTGMFTIEIPEDYIPLDAETTEQIMDMGAELGVGDIDLSILEYVDYESMDYIYSDDWMANFNVQVTQNNGMTQEMLEASADILGETLIEQYAAVNVPEENCYPQGIGEINGNTFYIFFVDIAGSMVHQYMTCNEDGDLFTFSFTDMDEEVEIHVLQSFTMLESGEKGLLDSFLNDILK